MKQWLKKAFHRSHPSSFDLKVKLTHGTRNTRVIHPVTEATIAHNVAMSRETLLQYPPIWVCKKLTNLQMSWRDGRIFTLHAFFFDQSWSNFRPEKFEKPHKCNAHSWMWLAKCRETIFTKKKQFERQEISKNFGATETAAVQVNVPRSWQGEIFFGLSLKIPYPHLFLDLSFQLAFCDLKWHKNNMMLKKWTIDIARTFFRESNFEKERSDNRIFSPEFILGHSGAILLREFVSDVFRTRRTNVWTKKKSVMELGIKHHSESLSKWSFPVKVHHRSGTVPVECS